MSGNFEEFVEKIKNTVDIVDFISDYVPLKRSGNNYKGLCPFHQEKTPSFNVNQENQFYYCFGCGAGGDLFKFLMEIENITFKEALEVLASRAGLSIPTYNSPYQEQEILERERIFNLHSLTARFYHYILLKTTAGKKALEYLSRRGFTEEDFRNYYLGYAPQTWDSLLKFLLKKGFTTEEILKAGLVTRGKSGHYYDRFRDRVIFPIFNIRGEVIAFGGRILEESNSAPKYLNSPETVIFKKSENLYGLNWARNSIRESASAIVMEGYTDVMTAHKYGLNNTIASLGTAFTAEHARLLKRYAQNIYIAYDADTAGAAATLRGMELLEREGLNVKVIQLPASMDPDDFIKKEGKEGFSSLVESAVSLIDYKVQQLEKEHDPATIEGKISFTKELVRLFARIDDQVKRDIYVQALAEKYNIEIETINKAIRLYRSKDSKNKDKNYNYRYTKIDNKTRDKVNINNIEGNFLKLYLEKIAEREKFLQYLEPVNFTGPYKKLVKVLLAEATDNLDELIARVDEESRKLIMALLVRDNHQHPREIISSFSKKIKRDIYRELNANKDYSLGEINQLLLRFIRITA